MSARDRGWENGVLTGIDRALTEVRRAHDRHVRQATELRRLAQMGSADRMAVILAEERKLACAQIIDELRALQRMAEKEQTP